MTPPSEGLDGYEDAHHRLLTLAKHWFSGNAAVEQGSALIEFALSAIVLFMMIFGVMDISRAVYIYHFVAEAAQEATRYAMVRGATWSSTCSSTKAYGCAATSSNVSAYVLTLVTPGMSTSKVTTTTNWPGTNVDGSSCTTSGVSNTQGCLVLVKVYYTFSFVLPLLPTSSFGISSTSEETIAQ